MKVHYIAHVRQDSSENWHSHLLPKVAQLAKRFAGRYGPLFAEYAGILHDLGKFKEAFQKYIRNASGFEKENALAALYQAGRIEPINEKNFDKQFYILIGLDL